MRFWKTAAFSAALVGAAGAGAALTPVAHGQSTVRSVAPRAIEMMGGGRIGVSVKDVDADAKTQAGVVIESVEDDSPAATAGFKTGDVVVEFDGERVRSVRQFTRLVSETPPGRQVAASVLRDGQRVSVNVTPRESGMARVFSDGTWRQLQDLRDFAVTIPPVPARPARPARPAEPPRPARPAEPPRPPRPAAPLPPAFESFMFGGNQLGVTVSSLSDQLGEFFGTKNGVLVASVTKDSSAAKAGVKAGDVIVSVNGRTVDDSADLRREMQGVDNGEEFTLSVVRDKKTVTLKGKMEAPAARRWTSRTIL